MVPVRGVLLTRMLYISLWGRGYKPQGCLVPERELGLSFSEDGLHKARSITISRLADGKSRH